jgi:hypothetical protein
MDVTEAPPPIGGRVRAIFREIDDGLALPYFVAEE